MNKPTPLTLESIGAGAAEEMFQYELEQVLQNISDPNTDPVSVREITIKFKFKPDSERAMVATGIACTSKLAPNCPFLTQIIVGSENGKTAAVEFNPQQQELFGNSEKEAEGTEKIKLMKGGDA